MQNFEQTSFSSKSMLNATETILLKGCLFCHFLTQHIDLYNIPSYVNIVCIRIIRLSSTFVCKFFKDTADLTQLCQNRLIFTAIFQYLKNKNESHFIINANNTVHILTSFIPSYQLLLFILTIQYIQVILSTLYNLLRYPNLTTIADIE